MKKRRSIIFITLLLIACLLLALLGIHISKRPPQRKTVRIGAVLPMTGNLSSVGESAYHGLVMAEEYVNQSYGPDLLSIIVEDGMGNVGTSISAANKLHDLDQINTIFSIVSSVDMALIPVHQKQGTLMFSHASHPSLSDVDSLFFRHAQTVQQEASFILEYLDSVSTVSLCYMNDDFGVAFNDCLSERIDPSRLVGTFGFPADETNFRAIASKVLAAKPQKLIICAGGKNISNLVLRLKELNYKGEIITTLSYVVSGANALTSTIDNLSMVDFRPIAVSEEMQLFISGFEKNHNWKIGTAELIFFNSAMVVFLSGENGTDPDIISSEIRRQRLISVPGSTLTITSTNDILPELTLIRNDE